VTCFQNTPGSYGKYPCAHVFIGNLIAPLSASTNVITVVYQHYHQCAPAVIPTAPYLLLMSGSLELARLEHLVVGNTCLYVPQILYNVFTEAAVNAHLFIVPGAVVDRMGRVVLQLETSTAFRGFKLS